MTRNYLSDSVPSRTVTPQPAEMPATMSLVQAASILTSPEILQSHEAALEGRLDNGSRNGSEVNLSQSIHTAIEVIGSPANVPAQRLAASLAALKAKFEGAGVEMPNTQKTTRNASTEAEMLQSLSINPQARISHDKPRTDGKNGPSPTTATALDGRTYRKSAFDISSPAESRPKHPPGVIASVFSHSDAKYDDIHSQQIQFIKAAHPDSAIFPVDTWNLDIFGFCWTGNASLRMITSVVDGTGIATFAYAPSPKRSMPSLAGIGQRPEHEAGLVQYGDVTFVVYFAKWVKGFSSFSKAYLVPASVQKDKEAVERFILDVGLWTASPKDQVWVFDEGYWQLDGALYANIMQANWKDIILPEELKESVLNDVLGFYAAEETYRGLKMPWKRGIVFYGPPGNGKTITLKAIMKSLYTKSEEIPPTPLPTLYVKSLVSWGGPEVAIRMIFQKAREQAPCFLIWEDLDSIIDDSNRSFFLNELDGLENNDGILVIGTTNHLDRLDPGIVKRPSRFDRKYLFDNPAVEERKTYVDYWRKKLSDTPIEFPDELVTELADLMKGFSFAYMKEAFVSTLLILAGKRNNKDGGDEWAKKFEETLKKQIKTLADQIDPDA